MGASGGEGVRRGKHRAGSGPAVGRGASEWRFWIQDARKTQGAAPGRDVHF